MSKNESDLGFRVDPDECQLSKNCFRFVLPRQLVVSEINGENKTTVTDEPITAIKTLTLLNAVISCPFRAFLLNGEWNSPEIKAHAKRIIEHPTILQLNRTARVRKNKR